MKTTLRTLILVLVTCLFGYLAYGIYKKKMAKGETLSKINSFPPVRFISLNGTMVTEKQMAGKPLWLIFFHSDCEYCQMEAENIRKAEALDSIQIWMVSSESQDSLSVFARRYDLDKLSYVQFLNDKYHADYQTFGVTASPASFLYSSNGALIKQYKGVVKMETVLKDWRESSL